MGTCNKLFLAARKCRRLDEKVFPHHPKTAMADCHPFSSFPKSQDFCTLHTMHLDYQLKPYGTYKCHRQGLCWPGNQIHAQVTITKAPLGQKIFWPESGGNGVGEEKKGESRWVRALRSIKCSETVKGKESDELGDCQPAGQIPRGALLLRVNSCSHLPTNANANKGERELIQLLVWIRGEFLRILRDCLCFSGNFRD